MGEQTTEVRKTRRSRPKNRSGCRTCKSRHVKCDEGRPVCQRCLSAGIICDGYGIWGGGNATTPRGEPAAPVPKQPRRAVPPLRNISSMPDFSPAEQDSLGYFHRYTSLKLPGLFQSVFWENLVVQVGAGEPSIGHAMIALASTHRNYESSGWGSRNDMSNHLNRFALQQYNKAIGSLRLHFTTDSKESLRLVLIASMLFVCLELLGGQLHTAITHWRNGFNLLSRLQSTRQADVPRQGIILRPQPYTVDDHLVEAFTHLDVQSVLFGMGTSEFVSITQDTISGSELAIPASFISLPEARRYLTGLMHSIFHFIGSVEHEKLLGLELAVRRYRLRSHLQSWLSAFEGSSSRFVSELEYKRRFGIPLLRIYHTMLSIMVNTDTTYEVGYDASISDFETILKYSRYLLAATYSNCPQMAQGHISFSMEMGIIAPLFYTAQKCRIPSVRRSAISMIHRAQHREGLWDGPLIAAIAVIIARSEQDNFQTSLDSVVPPESNRFHSVEIILPDTTHPQGMLIFKRRDHKNGVRWIFERKKLNLA